ncbi:hypothetical protein ACTL6P_15370 [Endozoicomonas acroporae]|uniref:hypothetical protein n=1 Tax=Endozoicomonas acroporae TaxID=1701104 RepID=UPI000C78EC87|nr:hypothetical protein [Endozoicomonas acroporae]
MRKDPEKHKRQLKDGWKRFEKKMKKEDLVRKNIVMESITFKELQNIQKQKNLKGVGDAIKYLINIRRKNNE